MFIINSILLIKQITVTHRLIADAVYKVINRNRFLNLLIIATIYISNNNSNLIP